MKKRGIPPGKTTSTSPASANTVSMRRNISPAGRQSDGSTQQNFSTLLQLAKSMILLTIEQPTGLSLGARRRGLTCCQAKQIPRSRCHSPRFALFKTRGCRGGRVISVLRNCNYWIFLPGSPWPHRSCASSRNLLANLKEPIDFKRFSIRSFSQLTQRNRGREFFRIGRISLRTCCRSPSASISASAAIPIRLDQGHRLDAP
jgi:hypothetical protein